MPKPLRFIHLTDCHIATGEKTVQFGVDTSQTLRRVLAAVRAMTPAPDFVLATGDLVNDGQSESYEAFRDLIRTLPSPVYFALGNHDERATFRRVVLGETASSVPYCYAFSEDGNQFLVLDSWLAGTSAGSLDAVQLAEANQMESLIARGNIEIGKPTEPCQVCGAKPDKFVLV